MSISTTLTVPDDLSDMLPVGMLANGGLAADAMAAIANRRHGVAGWEAFHYERISDGVFEITGGIALISAGSGKKWPGPHDLVSVSEAEILQEMRSMLAATSLPVLESTSAATSVPSSSAAINVANPTNPASESARANAVATGTYLNVVFALPEDEAGRQRILKAFHLQADFFGARVQSCSLQDQLK
jgi:hypothetical protein